MPDQCVAPYGPEMAAVRKILARMAGYGETDDAPTDEVQLACEAAERFEELAETVERLDRVVDTDLDVREYGQLTKKDKVRQIRTTLIRKAGQTGQAAMRYDAVRSIFNHHPSAGYAYDLMRAAGEAEGFDYQEFDDRDNRIVVKTDAVNDETLIRRANNDTPEQPA